MREGGPVGGGARRCRVGEGGLGGVPQGVEQRLGGGGADAGDELQGAEAGDAVGRVLGEAQAGEHVLDVGGVEELQAAELDEGDVAAGELDLERRRVVGGAEEDGLLAQRGAGLAGGEDLAADVVDLGRIRRGR